MGSVPAFRKKAIVMSILTTETRGGMVENIHCGTVCVVSENGVEYSAGRYNDYYFFRSSSKPIQALPVLLLGLDKKYGLTDAECAIMAGSNAGEDYCTEVVESLMKKTGVTEDDLVMLPRYPDHEGAKRAAIAAGLPPKKAWHGCTPKHIGCIIVQRELTGSGKNYDQTDSAVQRLIRYVVSMFTDTPYEDIRLGYDGCGVPVFATPGYGLAKSYLRMAIPELLPDKSMTAVATRMGKLMSEYPHLMRGRQYICTVMNTFPNIVAKGGACGVYHFGLKQERLGVMLKIYDGSETSWQPVIAEILRQISPEINSETIRTLETTELIGTTCKNIYNMAGEVIGEMNPVFKLEKHN